jgi:Protein of unknown function (DUF2637).
MAGVVSGVASVAAIVSYQHAYEVVSGHGEGAATARLVPLTVDGLVVAASLVMLDSARSGRLAPRLARFLLGLGIVATLAANVLHGAAHGVVGSIVAAWPAVAFVGVSELALLHVRAGGPVSRADAAETVSAAPVAQWPALVDEVTDEPVVGWLPDTLPTRPEPVRSVAARSDTRPVMVSATVPDADTTGDRTPTGQQPASGSATGATGDRTPVGHLVGQQSATSSDSGATPNRTGTRQATGHRSATKSATTSDSGPDMGKVRRLLARDPDMSGAALGRALGVSARTGQRLRQQAIDNQ